MDILTSSTSEGKFKKQECAGLAARALRQLAAYEEGVTALSDKLKKFLGTRIVEPADKSFFLSLAEEVDQAKFTSVGGFEEMVFAKGGDVLHSKEKITLTFVDGNTKQLENRLIPVPPEIEARPMAAPLVELTCAAFDIKEGKVTQITNQMTWKERFYTQQVAVDPTGLPLCKSATETVVKFHPAWPNVVQATKTLQGKEFF